jgi:hypothetical protein
MHLAYQISMTLSQDKGAHFLAVNCGKDWSSELACYAAMTTSRLHVKTSNVRHNGQNAFIKHARKPNMQELSTAETPPSTLEPRIRGSNICTKQVQLLKEMGMPIPRISRKLANINVRTRPSAPNACSNRVFS